MAKDSKGPHITQPSVQPKGSAGKVYTSGANVHKGGAPKPSKQAPASGPKTGSAG